MSYYKNNDMSFSVSIISIIFAILLLLLFTSELIDNSITSEREQANMVYIKKGFVYDADTYIIYREFIVRGQSLPQPIYSIYINKNGNYCKYKNGKWTEFAKPMTTSQNMKLNNRERMTKYDCSNSVCRPKFCHR